MPRRLMVVVLVGLSASWGCLKQVDAPQQDPVAELEARSAAEQNGPCDDGLFGETDGEGSVALEDDGTIVRRRFVTVDFDRLSAGESDRLPLNLFPDVCLVALRIDDERGVAGPSTWIGRVDGLPESRVTLVGREGSLVGTIDAVGTLYHVRDVGEGVHAVLEIDQAMFPEEAQPLSPPKDD